MHKLLTSLSILAFCLSGAPSFGQSLQGTSSASTRFPLSIDQLPAVISGPLTQNHLAFNQLSPSTNAALQGANNSIVIHSIPTFTSSFTFQGHVFPFTMVGQAPQAGGTTQIETSYLAISFLFDEFVDANGNNIVIDANSNTSNLLNGPDFEAASYTVGNTQFTDAVQRAEFFSVLNDNASAGAWHTLLNPPRHMNPVTIEVPAGASVVFQLRNGSLLAIIDFNFLISQLNVLLKTAGLQFDEIPIFATRNTVYASFSAGKLVPHSCCIGGFHTVLEKPIGNTVFLQLFDFATSLDAEISAALFGDSTAFADVEPLSHEITETFNDPFVSNRVPRWEAPGLPFIECSSALETGDPVENLPNASFPVTVSGFTYHPQTEALLQWFSRESPSSAFGGAYSYPGNNLTAPSTACPAGH